MARRSRRWLRWLVRLLVYPVALALALVMGLVGWVLLTEGGTRLALTEGLAIYNDLIPGEVRLTGVSGALIDELTLEGLDARDRQGRPLIQADRLTLTLALGWPIEGQHGAALRLETAQVHLRQDPEGDPFLDLAPPGPPAPPEPPDPDAPRYPEVPVEALARVEIAGLTVTEYDAAGQARPLVEDLHLALGAEAAGAEAQIILGGVRGGLPVAASEVGPLDLHTLRLDALWRPPFIHLRHLVADTTDGRIALPAAEVNIEQLQGDLRLDAALAAARARSLAGAPFERDPEAAIVLSGGLEGFSISLDTEVSEDTRLSLKATGAVQPAPRLDLTYRFVEVKPGEFGVPTDARVSGEGHLKVDAPPTPLDALATLDPMQLVVDTGLTCDQCKVAPVGVFDAQIKGHFEAGEGAVEAQIEALGAVVEAAAKLAGVQGLSPEQAVRPEAPIEVRFDVKAPRVSKLAALGGVKGLTAGLKTSGSCEGTLGSPRCKGRVRVSGFKGFDAAAERVSVLWTARVDGVLQPEGPAPPAFTATIQAEGARAPGLPGRLDTRIKAEGTPEHVTVVVEGTRRLGRTRDRVKLAAEAWPGPPARVAVSRLDARVMGHVARLLKPLKVKVSEAGPISVSGLSLEADEARITARGTFSPKGSSDLKLGVTAADLTRTLAYARGLVPDLPPVAGGLNLDVRFRGPMRAPRVEVLVEGEALAFEEKPVGDLDLALGYGAGAATVDLAVDAGQAPDGPRVITLTARAPVAVNLASGRVAWRSQAPHEARWSVKGVDADWLRRFAPVPADQAFAVATEGTFTGTPEAPQLTGRVTGHATLPELGLVPLTVDLNAEADQQRVVAVLAPSGSQPLTVDATARADLGALQRGTLAVEAIPITAQISLPGFDLKKLAALMPPALFQPEGRLAMALSASGTVGDPHIEGQVGLSDGALTVVPAGMRLTDLAMDLQVKDKTVALKALTFTHEKGRGRLAGQGGLTDQQTLDGDLVLSLKDFPVAAPGAPPMTLDTRVKVDLSQSSPESAAEVIVDVLETEVLVLGAPDRAPRAIPASSAVIFVDEAAVQAREAAARQAKARAETPPLPLNLLVRIPEPLRIYGTPLDMRWGGRVAVRQQGEGSDVQGAIIADGGFFELLGNRFEVESGEITLPEGSPEPYLRIEANTETPEARVTVNIRGRASAPELILSANPPMPEYQILTLLVTGTTEQNEESQASVESRAAGLLASFSNPALERQIRDKTGIDRVKVSFGETVEEPIVALGKSLTRWLYVETRYHHNAPPEANETEVRAEVRVAPRWTLETAYGDQSIGGVDLFWRKTLGSDEPEQSNPPKTGD